jgi:hypothetical protein
LLQSNKVGTIQGTFEQSLFHEASPAGSVSLKRGKDKAQLSHQTSASIRWLVHSIIGKEASYAADAEPWPVLYRTPFRAS